MVNRLHEKQEEEARVTLLTVFACEQDFRGAPAAGRWGEGGEDGKRKESLQLRRWNLNSTSNSPVAPRRTELSDFRESAGSGN